MIRHMALRNPSPMPDDPHDPLDQPVDEDEEVLGPVPEVTEGWEEAENEGVSEEKRTRKRGTFRAT